jgi:putative glycosyltransferase (TIGR04372 family)
MSHYQQIKEGGYKVFLRKVNSLFIRIFLMISGILAIPCVFLIRLFKGIILIRLGTLRSDRIGHFAADSGQHFATNILNTKRTVNLYWLSKKYISNKQLELMVRRNFLVFNFVRYLDYWNRLLPGGENHSADSKSRDIMGVLQKSKQKMSFLSSEESQAKDWMSSYGWKEGDPFVCILVRDSAYLKNNDVYKNDYDYDYSYHGYRDSNIENYIEAMEWLANQGIWVFRMGRKMHKPIAISHPKIIDYAFCENQSDLQDVWMFANCNLCISTGSGPDTVSDVYCRPMLYLNYVPICNLVSWNNAIHVPKHLIYIKTGKYLTLSEHIKHSYFDSEQYVNAGIEAVEMSSMEILQAVQERFKNVFEGSSIQHNNTKQNTIFWKILLEIDASSKNEFIHEKSGIADCFLKNNPNWLK